MIPSTNAAGDKEILSLRRFCFDNSKALGAAAPNPKIAAALLIAGEISVQRRYLDRVCNT
jgi:hypothetical protein